MTTRSPYGSEFRTFVPGQEPDLDPTFTLVEGLATLPQAILRSWFTPTGSLPENPNTVDIRAFAQQRLSATNRARCKHRLEAVARADERVAACVAKLEPIGKDTLRITGRITPRTGSPFQLVVDSTDLTSRLVSISPVT